MQNDLVFRVVRSPPARPFFSRVFSLLFLKKKKRKIGLNSHLYDRLIQEVAVKYSRNPKKVFFGVSQTLISALYGRNMTSKRRHSLGKFPRGDIRIQKAFGSVRLLRNFTARDSVEPIVVSVNVKCRALSFLQQKILKKVTAGRVNKRKEAMTHVQKYWTALDATEKFQEIDWNSIKAIHSWIKGISSLPDYINEEQIILFLHSCYNNVEDAKKCIDHYYRLRLKVPHFFQNRDISSESLQKALDVLYYGIFPERTPEGYKIVFHMLNDTNPSNYIFNDGFKLLIMMIDAVYAKEGPQAGLILLFDLKGVKLGHITKLPLNSVRRSLEYLQDAIPVRLKGIHVLNVHSIIDKIMILVKPFLRKKFLELLHFHKENDEEVYKVIPKKCLPRNYGGELESVEYYHKKFVEEMKSLKPLFTKEEHLMFGKEGKQEELDCEIDLANLNID